MTAALETYSDPNLVPSLLDEPASRDFSIVTLASGWPGDLERLHESLVSFCGESDFELVAASNNSPEVEEALGRISKDDQRLRGINFSQHVGYGAGINSAILRSRGKIVIVLDTSVEATGDFLAPLALSLEDEEVGLAGPWGLVSRDLRHFDEKTSGEVDAMQAYCMAFRRAEVTSVGLFDSKYKFYRNADIDYSLSWKDKGFKVLALALPLERHEHREWDALQGAQRDAKSRDNFARLLRRWGERTDLLTGRADPHPHGDRND